MKKLYSFKGGSKLALLLLLSVFATTAFSQKLTISTAKKWYCPGETAVLEASSGFAKYLWSTSSNDRTIKVTTGGKYKVTAWDSNSNPQYDSIEINFYSTKSLTINTKNNPICKGDTAILECSAGFLSYIWSTNETTRNIKVAPSATTSYYVYGKDSNGCSVKATYTLQVKSCGSNSCADLIKWKEKSKCAGDSVLLEAPTGYAYYVWQNSKNTTLTNDRKYWAKESGMYILWTKDSANNYCSDTVYINNFKSPALSAGPYPVKNEYCKGDTIRFEANKGFKTYYWSNQNNDRNMTMVADKSVKITLYVTDSFGCTQTKSWEITVKDCSTSSSCKNLISWKEKSKCPGDSVLLEGPTGYSYYKWQDSRNYTLNNDRKYWAKEPGMYILWTKDSANNYCTDTVYISNYKVPTLSAGPYPVKSAYCKGDTIRFESNKGFKTYYWSNQKNDRDMYFVAEKSVKITLYVADSNGCKQTKSWEITVIDCNSNSSCKNLISWKEKSKCPGDSIQVEAPYGYNYYKWSDAKNNTITNNRIFWIKESGMYVLWAKDSSNNYCTDTIYINNFKVPTLSAGLNPNKSTFCKGDTIKFEANKGFKTYFWSNQKNDRNMQMIAEKTTKITLYVTDSNGCKQAKTWQITVIDCNADSCANLITAYPKTTICSGDSVKLLGKEGMASYKWSNNKTDRYFYVKESGTWYLEAKTPGGKTCKDSVKVTVHKKKDFKISTKPNPAIICPGDTVIIEATSGMSKYSWNLGSNYTTNRAVFTLKEKKTIVVEAQDSNGCNYRAEVTVKMDTSCSKSSTNPCKEIKVYPNPTTGKIALEMKDTLAYDMKIEIYDRYSKLIGKDVWKSGNKKHYMDLTSYSNGYYYLKIYCNGGVIIKKIVKQ
jgi:SLT domain-containing protein